MIKHEQDISVLKEDVKSLKKQKCSSDKNGKFYCDRCDFSCGSKKSLEKHTSQSHEIPYIQDLITCNECDYETISENGLKDHMNMNHMEDVYSLPSNYEDYPKVDEAE